MGVRRMVMAFGIAAAILPLVPSAAGASGGGGCGGPVTDGRGTTVEIRGACFTPTILRVPVGTKVTWTNRDGYVHTVLGANAAWGSYAELRQDRSVSNRFTEAGTFPYVCTIHPGMVGTVVVGSGGPHVMGRAPAVLPGVERAANRTSVAGSDLGWRLATFTGFGLLGLTLVRRRIRRPAA